MPRTMPVKPDRLRVQAPAAKPVGVDREARVIRGMVVALQGPFKSEGRGEFDQLSLEQIVQQWPANGLKSRFSHPTESSDGLGKALGRARNPRLDAATVERDGKPVQVAAVRADLHFFASASRTPSGDLAAYVMDLAEEDPGAISSSLVLNKDEEFRMGKDGTPLLDDAGVPLPALWRVKKLHAADVVDEGDAVDSILAAAPAVESLRYARDYLAPACKALDKLFAGQPRNVVQARVTAFLTRYLDRRYGTVTQDRLGMTLSNVLDSYIEQATDDEHPREVIIAQMAEAAAISVEQVSAILQGEDEGVTTAVLEAFAGVLGCPLGELVTAAEEDGIDLTGAAEEEPAPDAAPAPEPAPAPDAPMMSRKTGVLRKKLGLKTKGF